MGRLASKLQVHPTAVYQWIRAATNPRPAHAAMIQRLARERGFKLTMDEIYLHSRELRVMEINQGTEGRLIAVSDAGDRTAQ